jgi:hypothetical protein
LPSYFRLICHLEVIVENLVQDLETIELNSKEGVNSLTKSGSLLEFDPLPTNHGLQSNGLDAFSLDEIAPASILETSESIVFDDSCEIHQTSTHLMEDSLCMNSQDHTIGSLLDQSSQLSTDQAYSTKVQTFLKARNLKGEFSRMERPTSRGRPQSSGRLYEKTKSFEVKCDLRKAREEMIQNFQKRSQSVGVRSRPTTPQAPKFHTSSRSSSTVEKVTSEELTYRAVLEQKNIQEKIMKKHQQMFENLKSKRNSNAPTTTRSTKELTIPTTPYSHVDHRLGKRPEVVILLNDEKKDTKFKKSGPTQIQPFQFSTQVRASLRGDVATPTSSSSGLTTGEILAKFHRDPRSHEVPKSYSNTVTRPLSPKLLTSSRSDAAVGRPKPPSRLELEEAEFKAAQAHIFKAKPVDQRILQSMGDLGVPKIQPKEATQPHEFHLSSSHRAAYRSSLSQGQQTKEDKMITTTFKARPMPSFDIPKQQMTRRGSKVTEPHSPKLHGPTRASSAPARRQRPNHQLVEKMKQEELLKYQIQNKKHLKLTEPEEFDFQTSRRGLVAKAALDAKLAREKEEERMRSEIHARPFPEKIFKESFILYPSTKPLTEIEEFHLATDDRCTATGGTIIHQENLENIFHARPLPKTTYQSYFTVEPSYREPLIPKDINLQSSLRAIHRKSFDEIVSQHQEEIMKQKQFNENLKEKKLQKELKQLRCKSIEDGGYTFKAIPILSEDPYPSRYIEPQKLTEPISPKLQTALRGRNSHQSAVGTVGTVGTGVERIQM